MPQLHRYKCLNTNCPGSGRKACTGIFSCLNSPMPQCPACRCTKVEDWGETLVRPGWIMTQPAGSTGAAQRIDKTLNGLAQAHGLTDISNRDGRAAKSGQMAAQGEQGRYGNMSIAGVDVPINDTPTGAWGSTPYNAFKVDANKKLGGNRAAAAALPTQVVARHEGQA